MFSDDADAELRRLAVEPASAMAARRRITGPVEIGIAEFAEPDIRVPVRRGRYALWRYGYPRLDVAAAAQRLVTIEESLAQLMMVTPGCTLDDRAVATRALARAERGGDGDAGPPKKRRWLRRGN